MHTLLTDIIQRTRQHHAIEHATLHVLAARFPNRHFAGISDPVGFTIYGEIDDLSIRRAVGDALLRLQAGEKELAIHPNCGTVLATTAVLVTAVALITGAGKRSFLERFTTALIFVIGTLIVARPLGFLFQSYTTSPAVSDRWLADIAPLAGMKAHRVSFA